MRKLLYGLALFAFFGLPGSATSDERFERLSKRYLDQFAEFSPVGATALGDHRYDDQLDLVDAAARERHLRWLREMQAETQAIQGDTLSRDDRVDLVLLGHRLSADIWRQTELQEWAWNPLVYTGLAGDSIYNLMAREFAPARERVNNAVKRLEQFPRFFSQVRDALDKPRVPQVHATTAVAQNRGVLSIIDNMILPLASALPESEQARLSNVIDIATEAIEEHQTWLEDALVPAATASYRLPRELWDQKLYYSLHAPISRASIRESAERRVNELHQMMFQLAAPINRKAGRKVASSPSDQHRKDVVRFALEQAYAEVPTADQVVAFAKRSAVMARDFIRDKDLVSLVSDPLEIMLMPEFRRGVSVAYCDSPGPLDVGQKTFYVVSPIPKDWTKEQTHSFLREYNTRSLHVLTIHEAFPGHYLQLAHANRYGGRLRHLLNSGVFIEGWACYAEWMMCEEGFLDHDPLMKLVTLKWYLRDAVNAVLDSAIHVDGMSRDEAMKLMMEDAFQEEREAAGKWKRAQLTSTQLSTYYVGYLEHVALREEAQKRWGEQFQLKEYHDRVLSFGSPPPQLVRALLFDEPIASGAPR